MTGDKPKGVRHVYSDAQLVAYRQLRHVYSPQLDAYRQLSATQKMEWLQAAWQLTVDLLPKDRLEAYQKFRRGEI